VPFYRKIRNEGAERLAEVLGRCTSLTYLVLCRDFMDDEVEERLGARVARQVLHG